MLLCLIMDIHSKNNLTRIGIVLIPIVLFVVGSQFIDSESGGIIFLVLLLGLALVCVSIALSFSQRLKCENCSKEMQIGIGGMFEGNRSIIPKKCNHCDHTVE